MCCIYSNEQRIGQKSMENLFGTKKLRKTKARNMIISILSQDKDKAFSAEDLHEACGEALRIDL